MTQQQPPHAQKISNALDLTLNPKNATQKGYKYIDDIIYDEYILPDSLKEILELIDQHGYKLGAPYISKESNIYHGLYMPIVKK